MWKQQIGVWAAVALTVIGTTVGASYGRQNGASLPRETAPGTTGSGTPVLVELFTSEGCSSCPPADTLLQDLQKKQPVPGARIIALSEHVTYWDRLGWKDPYSSTAYTARQVEYRIAFRNSQVYTPQVVVDGQREFVGSDRNAAHGAISRAAKQPKVKVHLTLKNGAVSVKIPALPQGFAAADVYAAVAESGLSSSVERGENAGRQLTHTAVVRQLERIGTTSPGTAFETVFRPKIAGSPQNQSVIVFVQQKANRRVLGVEEVSVTS